jgi:hypothetical protein
MSEDRSARVQHLRDAALRRALTPLEDRELEALLAEADAAEEALLAPAGDRLDRALAERREVLAQTTRTASELERVAAAQQDLLREAQAYLAGLRARRAALAAEARAAVLRTGTAR